MDKLRFIEQQISVLDRTIGIDSKVPDNVHIDIPARLHEGMKGADLKLNMQTFIEDYQKYLPLSRHFLSRIGKDIHPDTGLFWGVDPNDRKADFNDGVKHIFEVLPTESNNWSGLSEAGRAQYVKETKWVQQVLEHSFSKAKQIDVVRRIRQPFSCGLYKDQMMNGNISDGVLNYWCILSMTRPTDEQHRNEVEHWLNNSYLKMWQNNVAWDVVLAEVRGYIDEARMIGLRIKWMSTGRRYMQALERDNRMCFELMPFKKGGPDPQDCILHLEELIGAIEANVAESKEATKAKKHAMVAQIVDADGDMESMQAWDDFMKNDCEQAMFIRKRFNDTMGSRAKDERGPGVCKFYANGQTCRFGKTCRFEHSINEQQHRRPRPDFYPEGKFKQPRVFDKRPIGNQCFAQGCKQSKNAKGAFCLECHRQAVKKGGVKTKDNKWVKFPFSGGSSGIKRANLAATEEANVFWASDDGMRIVQDIEDN